MRNLLGRLHARAPESVVRVARLWLVPLTGNDAGRHVGALYRVMTDQRAVRAAWEQQSDDARAVIRTMTGPDARPLTLAEIAGRLDLDEPQVRETCVELFRWGILAREGDQQELPVGQSPKVFVPRELVQDFRRVIDEVDAGDQSTSPLRTLLDLRDDPDIEDTARTWGIQALPGLRRRHELIQDILKNVAQRKRIDDVVKALSPDERKLWDVVRDHADDGPMPLREALAEAGMEVPTSGDARDVAAGARLRDALGGLESSLLVQHTYLADGSRALFVPQEILHPGTIPTTRPLSTLQPIAAETVVAGDTLHPYAIAWDLLTVVREIRAKGAPVWVPGESLSQSWQRQVNSRLWLQGEEEPPEGYIGMLLYLGLGVGILEPGARQPTMGSDRNAIRPVVTNQVREWRAKSFEDQIGALRDVWFYAEPWIEARERDMVDVWGAQWQQFRRRLLGALAVVDPGNWLMVHDAARRFAEQDSGIVGSTLTIASAANTDTRGDARVAAVAQIIELELQTAMHWFGFVELGRVPKQGLAMRVLPAAKLAAADSRAVPRADEPKKGPALSIATSGLITLERPSPLHIWSLLAFADAETLSPATYQLRPGSVGRALASGFELEQIRTYLERQSDDGLPEPVLTSLRKWTAGYKRVRARRVVLLYQDVAANRAELRAALEEKGYQLIGEHEGGTLVLLPVTADSADPEETLFADLRAAGFAAQWKRDAD